MKRLRIAVLLALPLPFLGATCVTKVDQKSPTGPWVGEVVNTGPDSMRDVSVSAEITDAVGSPSTWDWTPTCPTNLAPNQHGTFRFDVSSECLSVLVPPLKAGISPALTSGEPGVILPIEGVSVRLLERDPAHQAIIVELRNDSISTYANLYVCANLRSSSGDLLDVGSGIPFPSVIRQGETRVFPITFHSSADGTVELVVDQLGYYSGAEIILDKSLFHITATKVVQTAQGRELQVVGESQNMSGADLTGVTIQAYLSETPAIRVQTMVGCNGNIAYGASGSVAFTLPLGSGDRPKATVTEMEASQTWNMLSLPVSDISRQRLDSGPTRMSATLRNPTNSWIQVDGVCFNLHGTGGKLVGTFSPYDSYYYIEPGGTISVSGNVAELELAISGEVVAYGETIQSPPIIGPPLP